MMLVFDLKLGIASPQKGSHFIFLILIFIKINYRVILNISYHLLWIKLLIYLNININNSKLTYEDELDFNIKMFSNFVSEKLDNIKEKIYQHIDGDNKFDVFIDFSGLKYEWIK